MSMCVNSCSIPIIMNYSAWTIFGSINFLPFHSFLSYLVIWISFSLLFYSFNVTAPTHTHEKGPFYVSSATIGHEQGQKFIHTKRERARKKRWTSKPLKEETKKKKNFFNLITVNIKLPLWQIIFYCPNPLLKGHSTSGKLTFSSSNNILGLYERMKKKKKKFWFCYFPSTIYKEIYLYRRKWTENISNCNYKDVERRQNRE